MYEKCLYCAEKGIKSNVVFVKQPIKVERLDFGAKKSMRKKLRVFCPQCGARGFFDILLEMEKPAKKED